MAGNLPREKLKGKRGEKPNSNSVVSLADWREKMGVYRRGKSWEVAVWRGKRYQNGRKKYYREGGFNSEKAAKQRENELKLLLPVPGTNAINDPIEVEKETTKTLLADVAAEWLAAKKQEIRFKSWKRYREIVELHLVPYFQERYLQDISRKEIKNYYFSKRDNIRNSVGKHRTIINQIWDHAEENGYIGEENNTVRSVKAYAAKAPRKNDEIIDCKEDMESFIASFHGSCLFLPVLMGGAEGMRLSEAICIKWSQVNLKTGFAHIKHSLHYDWENGGHFEENPKTSASNRRIKLSSSVVNILKKVKTKRQPKMGEYICLNSQNRPFNTQTISNNFKRAARTQKRGNREIGFKSLRTSFINIMRDNGVEDTVIQEHVGHCNINTTRQHYFQGTRKQRNQLHEAKENICKNVLSMTRI